MAMADEKKSTSGEAKDNDIPDLSDFLQEKGLLKYKDALIEAGLEEDLDSLKELDDDDMEMVIKEAKLKRIHAKCFRRAIKQFKDGTYKPGQQKILNTVREKRKHLRGYTPRRTDKITGQKEKIIIFIGQTGVGKTTCINAMCNYLEQISYDEKFRYELICEENDKKVNTKDKTGSQTQYITQYHLENLPALNNSAANIVDTPGFGDTEGPERDEEIQKQFRQFFEAKCSFIDGIYFIVKASDTRVGVVQKYIFNMVLDLFGKDVLENIFVLFTFSDGAKPPALDAVKKLGIKYAKEFRINNSGFWLPEDDENLTLHETYFNMGMKQFKTIFDELKKVPTKSTAQTKQTLKERANITKGLEDIRKNLILELDEIEAEKKTMEVLKTYAAELDEGCEITIQTTKRVKKKNPSKTQNLNCRNCQKTCCTNCWAVSMGWCDALNWSGNCTICSKKCGKKKHEYSKYEWKTKLVTEYVTKEDIARKYEVLEEYVTADKLRLAVMQRKKKLETQTQKTIQKMKKSVERLKEIALNPKAIGDSEYFDILITAQKQNKEEGWFARVTQLEKMKNNVARVQDIIDIDEKDANYEQVAQKFLKDAKAGSNVVVHTTGNVVVHNVNIYRQTN